MDKVILCDIFLSCPKVRLSTHLFPSNLFFPDILLEFLDQGHSKKIMQLNLILFLINMGILAKNELSNLDEKNSMECNAWGKKVDLFNDSP